MTFSEFNQVSASSLYLRNENWSTGVAVKKHSTFLASDFLLSSLGRSYWVPSSSAGCTTRVQSCVHLSRALKSTVLVNWDPLLGSWV